MKWAVFIFKVFASLKLAIFLLAALALVFAAGTFTESFYGTEAATLLVYRSPWMALLLVLLVLNLAASALDRLPWKKKHGGFVITHAGIILILAGSLVTRAWGVEGQMAVAEEETASRMILAEPKLQLLSADSEPFASYAVPRTAFPWKGKKLLEPQYRDWPPKGPVPDVSLLRYYPKASRETGIQETTNGTPALKVALESSFMKTSHWLLLEDPERNHLPLGPAELNFSREALLPKKGEENWGILEFQFEDPPSPFSSPPGGGRGFGLRGATFQIPLDKNFPKKFPLEGKPYHVTVLRVLRDAAVNGRELVDQSQEWRNPACELMLEEVGARHAVPLRERHTVFSNFPDFPTMHGMKPSQAGVRIFYRRRLRQYYARGSGRSSAHRYRRPETESPTSKNELRFVWQETGLPFYQIRKGEEISQGELKMGEEYTTGWMDFKFRAETYYPHARLNSVFKEEPVASQAEDHLSAVEIELMPLTPTLSPEGRGEGEGGKTLWLGQGDRESVVLGGQTFQILYGLRTLPVGFRIKLRDFRVEHDPGTRRPASFESDVTLMDDSSGLSRDLTIRMNEPLKHRGFKVFQSGYQQPEGGPEISIFTVAKDPGIPLKYGGAVVLIGGILMMFYSKQFSGRPKEELFANR